MSGFPWGSGQPPAPGAADWVPGFALRYQRATWSVIAPIATDKRTPLSIAHLPIDGLIIQSVSTNTALISILGGMGSGGIEIGPGQTCMVEIDDSRTVLETVLRFLRAPVQRLVLDAFDWSVFSLNPGQTVNVGLFLHPAEIR